MLQVLVYCLCFGISEFMDVVMNEVMYQIITSGIFIWHLLEKTVSYQRWMDQGNVDWSISWKFGKFPNIVALSWKTMHTAF